MTTLPDRAALRTFILRYIQSFTKHERYTIPSASNEEFIALFGLCSRVRRYAQGYLRLDKSGFGPEGTVLVRAALEHAITAQWAYCTPGGVDRLRVSMSIEQWRLAELLAQHSSNQELRERADALAEARLPGKGMPKFTSEIMPLLDAVSFLKQTYKVLSMAGHVTHAAALDHIVLDEEEGWSLREQPEHLFEHEVLYALAGFCMLSAWILARLEGSDEEIARLHEICQQLHVPWRLDTHLPSDQRRFPDEEL